MVALRRSLGLLVVLLAKFSALLLKLLKGLKLTKLGLGAAAFGSYALLTDWRFAAVILFVIGVHESGHVWAMRRSGVPTRGFYFLPFMGGVAIADAPMPDRDSTVFMALSGPVWGFGATLLIYAGFLYTDNPLWEVAACWGAFVNLLNLLPMSPLDGGHVVKALSAGRGTAFVVAFFLQAFALAFCLSRGYVFFFVIGMVEWSGPLLGFSCALFHAARMWRKRPLTQWKRRSQFLWYSAAIDLLDLPPDARARRVHRAFQALRRDPRLAPDMEAMRQVLVDFDAWKASLTEKDEWAFAGATPECAWGIERASDAAFYQFQGVYVIRTAPSVLVPRKELLERFLARRAELRLFLERADAAFASLRLSVGADPIKVKTEPVDRDLPRWLLIGAVILDVPWAFEPPFASHDREHLREENPLFALVDPRLEQRVLDRWKPEGFRSSTELPPLTSSRAALWGLTYAGFIFLLFSFMEMTGGHEAATHAADFFRGFSP